MGLFGGSSKMREAKDIITRAWRTTDLYIIRGGKIVDNSFDNLVVFTCEEENFGPHMKACLGSGTYHGSFTIMYNTKENYLVCDIYYAQHKRSASQLQANINSTKEYLKFDYMLMTDGPYPNIHISKIVSLDRLAAEVDNIMIAAASIID